MTPSGTIKRRAMRTCDTAGPACGCAMRAATCAPMAVRWHFVLHRCVPREAPQRLPAYWTLEAIATREAGRREDQEQHLNRVDHAL